MVAEDTGYLPNASEELLLEHDDILFNRTNSFELVGKSGIFKGNKSDKVTFASYLVRLRALERESADWLNYLLNDNCFLAYVRS